MYCSECCCELTKDSEIREGVCTRCSIRLENERLQDFWDNENPYDYTADL